MKLIYLMIVHKELEQINALIEEIYSDEVLIYAHVDKKSDINVTQINRKAKIIQNRIPVL